MRKVKGFEDRYTALLKQYQDKYDIEALDSPNDISNLQQLIRNFIMIELLQEKRNELAELDLIDNLSNINTLSKSINELTDSNMALERALALDRKSRKKDQQNTLADQLLSLKLAARDFLEDRIIKLYCPVCKVMVGRIFPVHGHTKFDCAFQCSQCKKLVTAKRQERDIFYDLRANDRDWRRKHPIIIQNPRNKNMIADDIEDDVIITDTTEFGEED